MPDTLPAPLAAAEAGGLLDSVTIQFARRPDGGLRVVCDELPGLVLSHQDHALVLTDLVPAIETLVFDKLAAALARAERAEKALKTAQSALAMLTEPNEIRSTSVANAWAIAVDAELQCRRALSASAEETKP